MGYVILIAVAVLFVVVLTLSLAKAAADFGGNAEERRKEDEAQIAYLKEWNRKQREKKKRS